METFDFLDYCYFLRRKCLPFVNSKLVHRTRLLVESSVKQLRIDKNISSRRNNSKSTIEVKFLKFHVKLAV